MNLFDRNGSRMPPRSIKEPEAKEKKPEDYIYMANAKAASRTGVVAVIAERLFQRRMELRWGKWWRKLTLQEVDGMISECIEIADTWQDHINRYQNSVAERVHNKEVERAAKSNIILPSWGETKDAFPGAAGMFPEAF